MGNKLEVRIQLQSLVSGETIITAGGTCHVAKPGSPDKATLYDKNGAALANPITPTRGFINFFIDDGDQSTVDLYVMTPGGHFLRKTGIVPGGPNEFLVDTTDQRQLAIIPFSIADAVANTEKDTGFDLPATCRVLNRLHGAGIMVTTLDSGQNILFGLLSTESGGDADGLSTNISLTTAIQKTGVDGALFSTNAPHLSDSVTSKSISYTLDTSTDTGKGFIHIPYVLS